MKMVHENITSQFYMIIVLNTMMYEGDYIARI